MAGPELGVKLYADTAELRDDLGKAAHLADKEMAAIARSATIAGAAIGTMAVSAAIALGVLVKKTIDGADQIQKLSQRTGIAVEALSAMKYAAELSDVSMGELSTAVALFNNRLVEAQDKTSKTGMLFRALGVDITAGPHQALMQFADAVRGLSSTEAQVAVLRQAFGRAGDKMLPFILGLRDSTEEAKKLGVVMSAQLARDAEQFKDNLKRLETVATTTGIALTNYLLPPLLKISERLVEARKEGSLFAGVMQEIARLSAQAMTNMPGGIGLVGRVGQAAFAPRLPMTGSQADVRRFEPVEPGSGGPNQDQVVCIASGGRWENGRCVRATDSRGLGEAERAARAIAEGEEMAANDAREAWEAYSRYFAGTLEDRQILLNENYEFQEEWQHRIVRNEQRGREIQQRDMQEWFRFIDDEQERAIEEGQEYLRALEEQQRRNIAAGRELGFTFSSAFEDAVLEGKKLSDVLKALEKDIARILLREAVTRPMANAIAGAIGQYFTGSATPRADGGMVMPNSWALVGERRPELVYFGPGGGDVIPSGETHGGRAMQQRTVTNRYVAPITINVGSLDPRTAAHVFFANAPAIRGVIRSAFNQQGRASPI